MKIGYFSTFFPYIDLLDNLDYYVRYVHGGTEVVAYNLAVSMAQRGHKVLVFTTSINSHNSVEVRNGVNIHRYRAIFKYKSGRISLNMVMDPLRYNLDVVHAHISEPGIEFAVLNYIKKKKIPFILTLHGDPQKSYGLPASELYLFFYKHLLDKMLRCANLIVSPSRYYMNESKFLRKYKNKIRIVPHGIDVKKFSIRESPDECREKLSIPKDKYILLYMGHLAPYKGPHILIKALDEVVKHTRDVIVIFAGGGKMKNELKKLAQKVGVANNVRFEGFVKESLKPFYYKSADIFILPSINLLEMFGIVNLEAMVCGLPVISSKLGGIPEIVKNGKNGLLVPPSNVDALSNATVYLLENENLRRRMGKLGAKIASEYSWNRIAERMEKIYKEVL